MGFMKRKKAGAAFHVQDALNVPHALRGALALACPYCKAKVGVPCRTKSGSVTAEPHAARESWLTQ
jgi:hypothetical protein